MDSHLLFYAVTLAVAAGFVTRLLLARDRILPYRRVERLSRPADPSFSGMIIERALGDDYYVLSKVNLVNLIQPREGLSNKQHAAALESVFDKQVDFAVCDQHSREIVGVIEVEKNRRVPKPWARRDKFLAAALSAAGIPIARVRPRKAYALDEVRQEILSALVPA